MVNNSKVYFLSRPRRFGKSLLVSTLKELFSGNKELFKDLWIEDKIEWKKYPVIHLEFAKAGYKEIGLDNYLVSVVKEEASKHDLEITNTAVGFILDELIKKTVRKIQSASSFVD